MNEAEKGFGKHLIYWYNKHKRALPWRESQDPYKIWLSEILLQQTRVAQGLPYYERFLQAFPDIKALAQASQNEVLRLWQGLGYYSRARNLHFTAQQVVDLHQGSMPTTYHGLLKLKGIGKYTAAAIASFAYGERVAVVDGNVYRVLARVFGIQADIASLSGQKLFWQKAEELLPEQDSSTYNQAIMEFGALHCTPQKPECRSCPLAYICYAFAESKQAELPVKAKKLTKKNRYFHYLVFRTPKGSLMRARSGKDIWTGLYEFPLIEEKENAAYAEVFDKRFKNRGFLIEVLGESSLYKHLLSHQNLFVKFWTIRADRLAEALNVQEGFGYYTAQEMNDLPKPVLIKNFLDNNE